MRWPRSTGTPVAEGQGVLIRGASDAQDGCSGSALKPHQTMNLADRFGVLGVRDSDDDTVNYRIRAHDFGRAAGHAPRREAARPKKTGMTSDQEAAIVAESPRRKTRRH